MPRGTTHREPQTGCTDPVTGRAVLRLTGLDYNCHHPYFYCRMFTPDGKRLVYVSDRSGHRNAYLLEIATGESIQLTDSRKLSDFIINLSPDGRHLYYVEDQQLRRMALATLHEETLYIQEHPYTGSAVSVGFSDDCTLALLCQIHVDDVIRVWDPFEPQFLARPRCRLILVNLQTGAERIVLEERCWLGHPQIRPNDPGTLMYCHEGPGRPCGWPHLADQR